ncbi:unnamed protein product [Rotaria sp. Silwood2]|nr:unnamed protein product [Rotaria sp. Silwood2]
MGFIPNIMLAKETTQYDELIDMVANGLFDTVMTGITVTARRNEIVDFSTNLIPSSYRIIIRKPKSIHLDFLLFLKPFSWELWLLTLATIYYTSILRWHLQRQNNEEPDRRVNNNGIENSTSYTFYTRLNRNSYFVSTNVEQFLTWGSHFLQITLFSVYTVSLLSSIIIQNSDPTISGINDIKNGKISPSRVGVVEGSAIESYYLNAVSQGKKNYYPLKTSNEVYTSLINGDVDAALWSYLSTEYHINNIYCDLVPVGVEFSHSSYQLPVKQNWLYRGDLDSNILSLTKSEELDRISAKWLAHQEDENKVGQRERFANSEDLIFQLADELYRCYKNEANDASRLGDNSLAKEKEELANQIHSELKKVHQAFFASNADNEPPTCTTTTLVWLKPKPHNDNAMVKVQNHFKDILPLLSAFDDERECYDHVSTSVNNNFIFLIINTHLKDSSVAGFRQLRNVKQIYRYDQLSSTEDRINDNQDKLCSQLTYDLIAHYNKLGINYDDRRDPKNAKDMFLKAQKLCHLIKF